MWHHYRSIVRYSQLFGSMDCNGEQRGHVTTAVHMWNCTSPASAQTHSECRGLASFRAFRQDYERVAHGCGCLSLPKTPSWKQRNPWVPESRRSSRACGCTDCPCCGERSGVCGGSGVLWRAVLQTGAVRSRRVSLKIQFLSRFHGVTTHTALKNENKSMRSQ